MIWLNEITAVPALLIWMLILRGFWPHLRFRGDGPLHYMVQGVSLVSAVLSMRLFYWDILRPGLRYADLLPEVEPTVSRALVSGGFNIATCVAGYLILRGLYQTLPEDDRPFYNVLTAPFYPNGILFFRKDREQQ